MSGRYEQLGRQLRKVRSALGKHDVKTASMALRRATHLAIDLVFEAVDTEDVAAALAELVDRRTVDQVLAQHLANQFTAGDDRGREATTDEVTHLGRSLDRLLRCLEHGVAMPELPFGALDAVEPPAAESRAALTISGRHVVIAARGGEGLVFIDERPVGRPFVMQFAPTSKATIRREPSGRTQIEWEPEGLAIELGPDFATAHARIPS